MIPPHPPPEPSPKRRELQKYQAGVFLIVLSLVLFVLGLTFGQIYFFIIWAFLFVTGIVFQFDKNRPPGRWW
jgi:membrane-bound ClpP family serine protease